jgi:hypothetical protein
VGDYVPTAENLITGRDSWQQAVAGIRRVQERLGPDRVSALMTTTETESGAVADRFCTTGVWYIICMELQVVIERISELLDDGELGTSNTSMRIPTALRDAATLAVKELGIASSATALTTTALRATLEAVVMQAALDDHYERHPQARPDLGDLAIAAAELDGHPLAGQPGRLRQAAVEIAANHPDASPDDVLLWAEARALPAA